MNHALIFSVRSRYYERSAGAHRIATSLRAEGMDVEVIDFAAHLDLDVLKEIVRSRTSSKTLFFGFSVFFNEWNNIMSNLTSWLKLEYPGIPTVIGGQNVSHTEATNIDYWVDSYGEIAILELVKSLAGNSSSNIKFDLETFGKRKLIKSNVFYPAYPFQSYANILEKRDFVQPYEWLTTEFARGCKFSCSFCNFPVLGVKGDYSRSQQDFEHEMKHNFDMFGVKNYYTADETFNDRTEKIIKFADVVEKLNFKPFFSGFIRADLLVSNKDSWEHLARLNYGGQYYGIETFNHKSGKIVGKGMEPTKLKQSLLEAKKYFNTKLFYRGTISLIVGLPHETTDTLLDTKQWILDNWLDQGLVAFPLTIENIEKNSNDYTNISDFGKNLFKYGLREIKDKALLSQGKQLIENQRTEWKVGNFNKYQYMWEHDTMNIIDANKISNDMNIISMNSRMDNFQLSWPCFSDASKNLLNKHKSITKMQAAEGLQNENQKQQFLSNYSYAKLNYRGL